jgi:glutaredoxin
MHVTVYSKPDCPSCTNAKMLLASRGIGYNELKLNEDFTRENLLELFPSAKSFPVIVVDGFNIGGFEQLRQRLDEDFKPTTQKLLTEGEWNGR